MKLRYLILLLPFILLQSCAELDNVIKLSEALKIKYACDNVNVSVKDREHIKITVINCPCCKKTTEEQQQIADSIGMMVPTYFDKKKLSSGEVAFETKNNFIIGSVSTSQSYDMHLKQ